MIQTLTQKTEMKAISQKKEIKKERLLLQIHQLKEVKKEKMTKKETKKRKRLR